MNYQSDNRRHEEDSVKQVLQQSFDDGDDDDKNEMHIKNATIGFIGLNEII